MKRILLIKPPLNNINSGLGYPLGLLYLSSYLKQRLDKIDIKLIDMRISSINNLRKLVNFISDYQPDIVGISCCSEDDYNLKIISREIKILNKNIMIVVGGPHATMYYEDILKKYCIDLVVLGEGEQTFYEIVNDCDIEKIKGIAYIKNGKIILNPLREYIGDLDSLPFPDWNLIANKIHLYSSSKIPSMNGLIFGKRYMGIITSRGCPYKCIYCHNILGKKFRKRSEEKVFEEIKILKEKYDIDEIHIYDDIFNLDKNRVKKICQLIINSKIKINMCFPNGLRGDIIDKEVLINLKKAGAYMVTFALETASLRLQKMIKKNIDINKLKENFIISDKLGFLTKCYAMLGFPTETLDEIYSTINFVCLLPITFASFFIVKPQKTTELYNIVKINYPNFMLPFDNNHYYKTHKDYENIIKLPLKKIQIKAYLRFYLNFKRIIKIFVRTRRKIFLFHNFFNFLKLIFNLR